MIINWGLVPVRNRHYFLALIFFRTKDEDSSTFSFGLVRLELDSASVSPPLLKVKLISSRQHRFRLQHMAERERREPMMINWA